MSDEARKNCRTQGRFSDGKGPKSKDKKHKNSYGAKVSPEAQYSRKNPDDKSANSTLTDENISPLKYEENSDYSFEQLEKVEKPEEIKGRGDVILSKTRNGESRIFFEPQFLPDEKSDHFFNEILDTIHWDTRNIIIHGVEYPQPRLVAWFGPFPYSYSGTTLEAAEMPDIVLEVKKEVESCLAHNGIEATFNSVLINLYRDGKDSVAWHSDDEIMLGFSPTIASVSLGETRKFELRSKIRNYDDQSPSNRPIQYFVNLTHGSLIVMTGCMQEDWQHRIPKEYHDKKERINLTFRTVYPLEKAPVKEINLGTEKRQSYGQTSSSKTLKNEYKLDDEHFPSLQKDIVSVKSNVTRDKYANPKNLNPSLKKDVTAEETWDSEICNNEDNGEDAVTHKNTFSVFDKKDENSKLKNNFMNEKGQNIEPKSNNVNDKTATKKLWSEYDSPVSDLQENITVEEKCHKSVNDSSANEIQGNKYYSKTDQSKVYDKEASLIDKTSYQNTVSGEEYSVNSYNTTSYINPTQENDIASNTHYSVNKSNSWAESPEESNLDINKTTNEIHIVDGKTFANSYVNVAQENDVGNGRLRNTCHYIGDSSFMHSSGKSNFNMNKPSMTRALNADAKEFIPLNMKSSATSQYSQYKLEDLVNISVDLLAGRDLQNHAQDLKKQIFERFQEVTRFERNELEFLLDLTDGSQTDKNQRLISNRICRIVINNFIINHESHNSLSPTDRSSRNRNYESQGGYHSDKGRRYPNQIRHPKSNRGRF